MFYRVAILAYFNYFLYCPCYSLTKSMEAKIAETNLAKGSIKVIFAKGTSVWSVFMEVVSTRGICLSARLSNTSSWISIK